MHPGDWSHVQAQVEKRIEGDAHEVRYEARFHRKDGETRHVEVAGSRVTYQGAPAAIATIQDVTEHRELQREILRVQEEERKRLGQGLHDGVASQLTGVSMMLSILRKKIEEDLPDIAERVQKILTLVEESGEDLRRVSRGLNPVVLRDAGLEAALDRLAANTERCEIEQEVGIEERLSLSDEEEAQLYWIAQEAVTNARRHAEAHEIVIRLEREECDLKLLVEDDGTGFDLSTMDSEGLGLRTMRYRAELMGAELTINSSLGEGTQICCRLPI